VLESASTIVDPGVPIDQATQQATKVTQELVSSQGVSFSAALDKLTGSLNTVVGSGKFRVCSFGDWPVRYALALEALRCNVTVPDALVSNFVNVLELHYDQNPAGPHVSSIAELLSVHELEPIAN